MIYVDASVVLAAVFVEDQHPKASVWESDLISSRLVDIEVWCTLYRRSSSTEYRQYAQELLERIDFFDITPTIIELARSPLPRPLRTLDALHIATLVEINSAAPCALATYDREMAACASAFGLELADFHL